MTSQHLTKQKRGRAEWSANQPVYEAQLCRVGRLSCVSVAFCQGVCERQSWRDAAWAQHYELNNRPYNGPSAKLKPRSQRSSVYEFTLYYVRNGICTAAVAVCFCLLRIGNTVEESKDVNY